MDKKKNSIFTIYNEAGNWVRVSQIILWSTAGVFVPLSLTCVLLGFNNSNHTIYYAIGSILLFGFWLYLTIVYKKLIDETRNTLIHIEEKIWCVSDEISLYKKHGIVSEKWYGIQKFQILYLIILIILWISIFCNTD